VLTPNYIGIENALDLPQAATMCGQCAVVCPVKIPLPDLMRKLREQQMDMGLRPWYEKMGFKLWAWAAKRPGAYALLTKLAVRMLKARGNASGMIRVLPLGAGWTEYRDMPAPAGKTFRELYAARKA
jgi:L-lactate dehydrogenase complex protein LldF